MRDLELSHVQSRLWRSPLLFRNVDGHPVQATKRRSSRQPRRRPEQYRICRPRPHGHTRRRRDYLHDDDRIFGRNLIQTDEHYALWQC
jgi:hypothetical protein